METSSSVYRDLLAQFMDELNLADVLRIKNPSKRCSTYESSALKLKSGIDFFLIPKSLIASTKQQILKLQLHPITRPLHFSCNSKARKRVQAYGKSVILY